MVILGLGSNVGDKLAHLRTALSHIQKIPGLLVQQVSPIYISDALLPENAPDSWNNPYLNLAIRCECSHNPSELLQNTKKIEALMGRKTEQNWGPRNIDIDILAWNDLVQYDKNLHIPHENLHERPFALWPLADVAPFWVHPRFQKTACELVKPWGSRFDGETLFHTQQIAQRIDTPVIVGILNVTPNSFSDGFQFQTIENAIKQTKHLVKTGAEIVDIGAEATGPAAVPIDEHTEWERLQPILEALIQIRDQFFIQPKISIDTRRAAIAEKALAMGVDWINDVSGLTDPKMNALIQSHPSCQAVIMHNLGIPADPTKILSLRVDPVEQVLRWAESHLQKINIDRDRVIFDAGIGFGKNAEQSLELLRRYDEFKTLGVRLLAGHSRKSFLTLFNNHIPAERDIETAIISSKLAHKKIDFLRVHNADFCSRSFKVDTCYGPVT